MLAIVIMICIVFNHKYTPKEYISSTLKTMLLINLLKFFFPQPVFSATLYHKTVTFSAAY